MFRAFTSRRSFAGMAACAVAAASSSFLHVAPVRAQAASAHAQDDDSMRLVLPLRTATSPAASASAAARSPCRLCPPVTSPPAHAASIPPCSLQLSPAETSSKPAAFVGASGAAGALDAAAAAADGATMTPAQATQCEEWKAKAINQSRKVNYLFRALKRHGCPVDPHTFIHCTACDAHMNGALFHDAAGHTATLMCGNRLKSYESFEIVLAHELLHAFDHCRAEVDPTNLHHHACMEIRAASLSGDCTFRQEARLGNINLTAQQPRCVRRRAILSVLSNPACADVAAATKAVDDVFDRCYADVEPFGAIP